MLPFSNQIRQVGCDVGPDLRAGWFSFIGEAALAGAYAASISALITSLMLVNYGVVVTPVQQLGIYTGGRWCLCTAQLSAVSALRLVRHCCWTEWVPLAGCLILSGAVTSLPARALASISAWGCWWIFTGIIIVVTPAALRRRRHRSRDMTFMEHGC